MKKIRMIACFTMLLFMNGMAQAFVVEDEHPATTLRCPHLEEQGSVTEYLQCSYTVSKRQVREEALARKRAWCFEKLRSGEESAECEEIFGSPSFDQTPAWCMVAKHGEFHLFGPCDQ
jgi:hypothetical protein